MSDEEEHAKMTAELTALCGTWNKSGIKPVAIVAFMLKAAVDTAEHCHLDYEIAIAIVDRCYGRDNLLRPNAKA